MKIIGIHGKARSGKDEVAHILSSMFNFKQVSFAGKLKQYAIKYFEIEPEHVYQTKTVFSRKVLQALGAVLRDHIINYVKGKKYYSNEEFKKIVKEYFQYKRLNNKGAQTILKGLKELFEELRTDERLKKDIDKFLTPYDIWIYLLFRDLKNNDDVFVVSDLRYKNEYNYIKFKGGKTLKIYRESNPKIEAGETHQSEIDLDDIENWDAEIINYDHKDWHELLVTQTTNIVREFAHSGFLSEKDIEKFKVNLNKYA